MRCKQNRFFFLMFFFEPGMTDVKICVNNAIQYLCECIADTILWKIISSSNKI